ncbi:MAG: hypothetical protein K2H49_03430, partial [Muribaculaceae bacterium]|nr:hypothetical protein [Muribaculaceae bacterium]
MKLTYFYNIIGFLCSLSIFPALSMQSHAENKIEFNGVTYNLSESTVLLDAEGIYEHDDACKDPIEAFNRINNIGPDAILLVAPSVYWLDDPDDPDVRTDRGGTPYAVRINCEHLKIIGLSDNPEDFVFAVNRGQTQGAVGNFTMFHFTGSSLEIGNITFGNYCNIDLVYPRNTELNRDKRKDAIVQAQIGICQNTDRLYAENCRFISRLNLCPFIGARRSLYDNCYFECTDDALSGSAVYLDCKFKFFSSKPFYSTAETGAVFLNCDIECLGSGVQYFTKVPGKITVINTRFHSKDPIEIKWTRDASDIICRQMNNTLNGIPYIIDSDRLDLGPELSDSSIKDAYLIEDNDRIVYNLPNLLSGDDDWDPKGINSLVKQLESKYGRKLTGIPVSLRIKSDKTTLKAVNDTARILSTPLLWGSYEADDPSITTYVSENTSPEEKEMVIRIST